MAMRKPLQKKESYRTLCVRLLNSCLHVCSFTAPYVKVYLLDNGVCKAKKKTKIARKTLDPLYQQVLLFDESPQGKVLQVSNICKCYIPLLNG